MKDSYLERFFREHLEAQLPTFAIQKNLMYMPPVDYVLKAVNFDSSSFSKSLIYVDMFIQPTFTPLGAGGMLINDRIGSFDLEIEGDAVVAKKIISVVNKKVLPLFNRYTSSPTDIISLLAQTDESYELEALAYAFVLTQQWDKALSILERLARQLQKEFREWPDAKYYEEWIDRISQMMSLVKTEPSRGVERLEGYRVNALRELGFIN